MLRFFVTGWNLYELHAPIVKQAKNQFLRKEITENELKSKLEKAVKLLKEVVLIFSYDDPCSPEGIAGKMASYALENLKSSVQDLTKISLLNQI